MAQLEQRRHTSLREFVDSRVQTIPVTEEIIAAIMPFFPKSAKVISGYLSAEDLYWKVNFHWDYLREAVLHCEGLDIEPRYKAALAAIRKALDANPPDPATGYRTSNVGSPKDKSSHEQILARHAIVKQAKVDFKDVVSDAKIFSKSRRDPKALQLAYAPVASPKNGRHVTGYALDIKGDNLEITRIAKSLGATLVFDEGSHVHCEWRNGVDKQGRGGADSASSAQRGTRIGIDSKITNCRHCLA